MSQEVTTTSIHGLYSVFFPVFKLTFQPFPHLSSSSVVAGDEMSSVAWSTASAHRPAVQPFI